MTASGAAHVTASSGVQRSGKSSSALQIVDEFQADDYDDEEPEVNDNDGADEGNGKEGKESGKLATWFKSLFSKSKDKSSSKSSKRSSVSSSRATSTTHAPAPPAKPASPTSSKPTSPTTPIVQDAAACVQSSPARSKSSSHIAATMPNGTTSPRPAVAKVPATGTAEEGVCPSPFAQEGATVAVDAVASPVSRSKSISLKSELQRLRNSVTQHSKSFTELSLKAKTVPKRGNELLIVSPSAPPRMQRAEWSLRDYAVVEKMYKGYASSVYKAFCKRSGELVCLKAYDMAALCELNRFQIYREVQLHGKLAHNNVIGLYGAFQVDSQVVMVQEFADGGDLFTLLHRYGGRMPERQAVEMVLQPCLRVLLYLHEQGILHRDLKPENILFTRNMTFKLCDFGLAIDLRDERAVTRAGTLEYMAPEVLECPFKSRPIDNKDNERLHYTAAVDAWAVGVLAYELLVGRPPFEAPEREGVEDCIRRQTPRFPFGLSELARSFIATALQKDPEQRPTVQTMLAHPFIRGGTPAHPAAQRAAAATVVTSGGAQPPRSVGSAAIAAGMASVGGGSTAAAGGSAAAAAAAALAAGASVGGVTTPASASKAAVKPDRMVGTRAIAAAGGMDDDELGMGALANRMKSYTAGKAIAISHQALQANRHVHLPHVGEDPAGRAQRAAAAAAAAAASAAAVGGGAETREAAQGGTGGGGGGGASQLPGALVGPGPSPEQSLGGSKLSSLNPKLAASLGAGANAGGMARTASVSRIM
ncbi:hypothetical protein PLESTB_000367700 [Pleodorina starrii]|uniref:Protein kinase domain-containing protein n=1 Tax=Pleodorina starrii TaxID=330485 RepID=A0A9W6BEI9_9CHLO|nr:hypothetical protein PLESTM_000027200 [Pleodorina starrii]GLC50335.1 hypothetical protein PLESTB_000367700 [Pleodorina starrii]